MHIVLSDCALRTVRAQYYAVACKSWVAALLRNSLPCFTIKFPKRGVRTVYFSFK